MKTKIYNIAVVQTGVFAKKSPTPNAVYLQQSDFDEEGNVDVSLCPTIEVSEKYLLNSGDLLVVCKGSKNQCIEVPEMGYKAVASSSFLVTAF